MKKLAQSLLLATVAVATVATTVVVANPDVKESCRDYKMEHSERGRKHGMKGQRMNWVNKISNLTDDQREQITQLKVKHKAQRQAIKTAMLESRQEMKMAFENILTDAQRQELTEIKSQNRR